MRVVGDLNRPIKKAAVLGGSGGRYWKQAQFRGADVLVTGDVDFHTAQDALAAGIAIIDPGHHAEKIMKDKVAGWLKEKLGESRYNTEVYASKIDTEPFQFM
ncbi:putative GTP cyclohydrolase 1 type 2 [compost metagenome]